MIVMIIGFVSKFDRYSLFCILSNEVIVNELINFLNFIFCFIFWINVVFREGFFSFGF